MPSRKERILRLTNPSGVNTGMSLSYAVSKVEKLVRVSVTGSVVSDDLPKFNASLGADPDIEPGMSMLVKAENVEPDLTFTDLRNVADFLRPLKEKGIQDLAIVTDTAHIYALAQVYAVFAPSGTVEVKVFRGGPEAATWLSAQSAKRSS